MIMINNMHVCTASFVNMFYELFSIYSVSGKLYTHTHTNI